jgi:hypothetical protein
MTKRVRGGGLGIRCVLIWKKKSNSVIEDGLSNAVVDRCEVEALLLTDVVRAEYWIEHGECGDW